MKLPDIILLSLSAAFLLIGSFETVKLGISNAYWSFMLSIIFFFWYGYRKRGN